MSSLPIGIPNGDIFTIMMLCSKYTLVIITRPSMVCRDLVSKLQGKRRGKKKKEKKKKEKSSLLGSVLLVLQTGHSSKKHTEVTQRQCSLLSIHKFSLLINYLLYSRLYPSI